MVAGNILVGHVMVDGPEIVYAPPGIPTGVKWMFVIPETYSHFDLPNSWIYCFTDTPKGRKAMIKWLIDHKRQKPYNDANIARQQFNEDMNIPLPAQVAAYQGIVSGIVSDTQNFSTTMNQNNLSFGDPNFFKTLFDPKNKKLRSSLIRTSTVFRHLNYHILNPTPGVDSMALHDKRQIGRFTNPPYPTPPEPAWDLDISSAQVYSGTLHLFDAQDYGGTHLALAYGDNSKGHPDGRYPNLGEFAFDNCTRSLQQAP